MTKKVPREGHVRVKRDGSKQYVKPHLVSVSQAPSPVTSVNSPSLQPVSNKEGRLKAKFDQYRKDITSKKVSEEYLVGFEAGITVAEWLSTERYGEVIDEVESFSHNSDGEELDGYLHGVYQGLNAYTMDKENYPHQTLTKGEKAHIENWNNALDKEIELYKNKILGMVEENAPDRSIRDLRHRLIGLQQLRLDENMAETSGSLKEIKEVAVLNMVGHYGVSSEFGNGSNQPSLSERKKGLATAISFFQSQEPK